MLLNGKNNITLELNSEYIEKGASTYNLFGKTTNKVKVSGNVNNKKVGKYKIKYKVSNKLFFNDS